MKKVTILNINIDNVHASFLLENLNKGLIVTPNVDHLVKLQKDKEFYDIYKKADWVICDSKIVYLCSKLFCDPIKEVIPGSSLFPAFCEYHRNNSNIKIYLLGSQNNVAQIAMESINKRIGRNIVVGARSPSFGFEKNEQECNDIITSINESGANVLIVGVGAPKQEKWIDKYKSQLSCIDIFMPLGATIDFEANNIKRAPKIYQKLAIEWVYRMLNDPKRLIKRYLIDDIPFFYYIMKQKLGTYKNPFE